MPAAVVQVAQQLQEDNPWGIPVPNVAGWNPDAPPGQNWGDAPVLPGPVPPWGVYPQAEVQVQAVPALAAPIVPLLQMSTVARRPFGTRPQPIILPEVPAAPVLNEGNVEQPPPSYEEVMASSSVEQINAVKNYRDSGLLFVPLSQTLDVQMACRCGNGRNCEDCRASGAPSTSTSGH